MYTAYLQSMGFGDKPDFLIDITPDDYDLIFWDCRCAEELNERISFVLSQYAEALRFKRKLRFGE